MGHELTCLAASADAGWSFIFGGCAPDIGQMAQGGPEMLSLMPTIFPPGVLVCARMRAIVRGGRADH